MRLGVVGGVFDSKEIDRLLRERDERFGGGTAPHNVRHSLSVRRGKHGSDYEGGKKKKTREPYHSMDMHDGIGEDDGW